MNIRATVNNSNLPINISRERTHLLASGSAEKFPVGPILPIPGPTLLTDVATALIASSNVMPPIAVITTEPIVNINKYKNMNASRLYVILLETGSLRMMPFAVSFTQRRVGGTDFSRMRILMTRIN